MDLRRLFSAAGLFAEEIILLLVVVLNVLDFLELLNPDLDYVKKILSVAALCYLFYKVSPTRLMLGARSRLADAFIISGYLMLGAKNLVGYSYVAVREMAEKGFSFWARVSPVAGSDAGIRAMEIQSPLSDIAPGGLSSIPVQGALSNLTRQFTFGAGFETNNVLVRITNDAGSALYLVEPRFIIHRWHNLILDHAVGLQEICIVIGMACLLLTAFYFAFARDIKKPSMMAAVGESTGLQHPPARLRRALVLFLALNFFFLAIFNLALEWLGLAVDAPIVIIGIFFYLLVWVKHHDRFHEESIIFKIGNFGESFFEKAFGLMQSKKGIILAMSGMLVLHLLTDLGVFIIPAVTGLQDPLYIGELNTVHDPIFAFRDIFAPATSILFLGTAKGVDLTEKASIVGVYFLNIIAALFLFAGPAFFWYVVFEKKQYRLPLYLVAAFFSSVLAAVLSPAFHIGRIESAGVAGIDITTQSILGRGGFMPSATMALCIAVFAAVLLLQHIGRMRERFLQLAVFLIMLFFAYYISLYFIDISSYYVFAIATIVRDLKFLVAAYMLIFYALTIIFYAAGFLGYAYECLKN